MTNDNMRVPSDDSQLVHAYVDASSIRLMRLW